jgi:hypothetical protein
MEGSTIGVQARTLSYRTFTPRGFWPGTSQKLQVLEVAGERWLLQQLVKAADD